MGVYIYDIIKEKVFLLTHTSYTRRVLHEWRRYLCLTNWGHLIHPDHGHHSSSSTMWPEQQAPTNHQGISYLAIVPTNNYNLHNMWRYSLKPMFVPQTHYLFGDSHAVAEICALNLGNFGVQTTIKSILLTLLLVWGDSLSLKLSPQWCLDVNGIDLIVVPTPKFPKVSGHFKRQHAICQINMSLRYKNWC